MADIARTTAAYALALLMRGDPSTAAAHAATVRSSVLIAHERRMQTVVVDLVATTAFLLWPHDPPAALLLELARKHQLPLPGAITDADIAQQFTDAKVAEIDAQAAMLDLDAIVELSLAVLDRLVDASS